MLILHAAPPDLTRGAVFEVEELPDEEEEEAVEVSC
jgi:hypothetical protein